MPYTASDEIKFHKWKDVIARHKKLKRFVIIACLITAFGWLLLFYKMSQTSEAVLRYSTEAQESVGTWTMWLLAMSVGSVALVVISKSAKKRGEELAENLKADLRNHLNEAGEGHRSKIESQLRELGA
ncbi:hypothetical protein AAG612_09990 [Citromicrobium bathyomarinum]|uniref:hypothetical protein n=1 Tax=Citromicrobium bathyomarinum TaxID=72174 RepID=UPI00315AB3D9